MYLKLATKVIVKNEYKPTDLPIYNAYIQVYIQYVDPVQSLTLFLNCLSFLEDLIMSGSVFHSILPLNLSEFNPCLTVLILSSCRRSFSKIVICGPTFEEIPQKGGIFEVKQL